MSIDTLSHDRCSATIGATPLKTMRCTQGATTSRQGIAVCGSHAGLHDEYATYVGQPLALVRITQGRAACGDLNAAGRAHSMTLLTDVLINGYEAEVVSA